ncbi:MAG: SURF1 family protein [Alphaproteobacteria bacterium]
MRIKMSAWRFRPTLWPTVFTLPALAVLIGLGTWQMERMTWKQDMIETRGARASAVALAAPARIDDFAEMEFRRVRVEGAFLHGKEMYLGARTLRGNVGYQVVTPLRRSDGSFLLVNRGWVPRVKRDPETRTAGQPTGKVVVEGLVRSPGFKGAFPPDNQPEKNFWFHVDIPAMTAWAGLGDVANYVVDAGPAPNPGGLPIGGQTRIHLRNEHLQYALTWYALAVALLVIYILYHRRRDE